jgi:flagellar biosynthesis protein FlhB
MAGDKTEKATPKKRDEARKKGQVARSMDLTGAVVMLTGLFVIGATGSSVVDRTGTAMREFLLQIADPSAVSSHGVGELMLTAGRAAGMAILPIAGACALAAIVVNAVQVRPRLTPTALKPDPRRLNPISGAKNIFGPNSLVEGLKSVSKVLVVGGIVALAIVPQIHELGALVGIGPAQLGVTLAGTIKSIAMRAAVAYLLIGAADYAWQRHRHEKSLRMDKQEIKEEAKSQQLPSEVKGAIRRRQVEAARARMMAAVPEADVVVTNPTHFSVALKYDSSKLAPEVVAKGQDLIALRIREIAAEHGVPVVPDPPLARGLHASVEVGQLIPEEFFQAVAQVLAFVYRVADRRRIA